MADLLKELSEDDIPLLLDELKSDWPINVHAVSFLSTIQTWRAAGSDNKSKVFALNGDVRSKFIVFYSASPDLSDIKGLVHKWTHRDDDEQFFIDVLHNSRDLVPWNAKMFLVTAVTPESSKVVLPFLTEIWKDQDWLHDPGHHLYWIPKEKAKQWTIDVPHGTNLTNLTEAQVKEINDVWPRRFQGSGELFANLIKFGLGLGLFNSASGELMSWALQFDYGGVGSVHTKDHHLRKGYASVIVRAICKELAERGEEVHLNVLPKNLASISLMEKLGFQVAYSATWIFKGYIGLHI